MNMRLMRIAIALSMLSGMVADTEAACIGTKRVVCFGKKAGGGGGGGTGNDLLVNTGLPMFSIGTTPILVQ